MIIDKKRASKQYIEIDLNGPDGNAFALIGITMNVLKQLKRDSTERDKIRKEMMSGDYENLLQVMEREIGPWIVMYR